MDLLSLWMLATVKCPASVGRELRSTRVSVGAKVRHSPSRWAAVGPAGLMLGSAGEEGGRRVWMWSYVEKVLRNGFVAQQCVEELRPESRSDMRQNASRPGPGRRGRGKADGGDGTQGLKDGETPSSSSWLLVERATGTASSAHSIWAGLYFREVSSNRLVTANCWTSNRRRGLSFPTG
ncbi:hypothetical protein GN956_G19652 [Arapaima gigas]